jgi:hypothetical protein
MRFYLFEVTSSEVWKFQLLSFIWMFKVDRSNSTASNVSSASRRVRSKRSKSPTSRNRSNSPTSRNRSNSPTSRSKSHSPASRNRSNNTNSPTSRNKSHSPASRNASNSSTSEKKDRFGWRDSDGSNRSKSSGRQNSDRARTKSAHKRLMRSQMSVAANSSNATSAPKPKWTKKATARRSQRDFDRFDRFDADSPKAKRKQSNIILILEEYCILRINIRKLKDQNYY